MNLDISFYRFVTIHACDGRTDRRADRILIARPRLHSMQRGKKDSAVLFSLILCQYSIPILLLSDALVNCVNYDTTVPEKIKTRTVVCHLN